MSREIDSGGPNGKNIPAGLIILVEGSTIVLLIAGILLIGWRRGSISSRSEE